MAKVLVLGSNGMAGHMIHLYLGEQGHHVCGLDLHVTSVIPNVRQMDVQDLDQVKRILQESQFDVVINCVGILNQFAEQFPDKAVFINAYLPQWFAQQTRETGTRFIHLSTDCVFSGKTGGYREDDFRDGDSLYDRSKSLGELNNSKDLTFRQSIIGPELHTKGIGLMNWFFNQNGSISGYRNAVWNGITTLELAKGINQAISENLTGLYHLVSPQPITKCDLLGLSKEIFSRNTVQIVPVDKGPRVDKTLVNTRTDFSHTVPSYLEMLREIRVWMEQHSGLYAHYSLTGNPSVLHDSAISR